MTNKNIIKAKTYNIITTIFNLENFFMNLNIVKIDDWNVLKGIFINKGFISLP